MSELTGWILEQATRENGPLPAQVLAAWRCAERGVQVTPPDRERVRLALRGMARRGRVERFLLETVNPDSARRMKVCVVAPEGTEISTITTAQMARIHLLVKDSLRDYRHG